MVILCPSLIDITNYYPLPQPPFNLKDLKNINNLEIMKQKKRLKLIANPQLFQLNEVVMGVANFDVVKDMIANSLTNKPKPTDLSYEMMILQRSFYPLLANSLNEEIDKIEKTVVVDYRKLGDLSMGDTVPDILISPSAYAPFVKKISSTICINPGTVFKGNSPGTFAKIAIFPPSVIL
jgi:DNA polymerase alpha subunit B